MSAPPRAGLALAMLLLAPAVVATAAHGAEAEAAVAAPRFAPPAQPLLFTRELRRTLPDGNEIVTRRQYRIRFTPEAGGYVVDGAQTDVTVTVPPRIAALGELEKTALIRGFSRLISTRKGG